VPTLHQVLYGGAPMAPAAIQRALEQFGPIFVQLYGQGETPMTTTVLRRQDHVPELLSTVGRTRLGIDVEVLDEDGRRLAPGEVGEVVVRGPSVMAGYWERADATAEALRGGWLHTGDLGRFSPDGVLTLLDRTKDMIISGGSNVYAVEVEAVLATSDVVSDVAVVGVADELWGERVEAVVVLAPGATLSGAALDELARSRLADYKVPRCYHLADALPRNAYGKVMKNELRRTVQTEHDRT
jgi:long-chain acyl-CoA synthetase